MPSDLQVDNIKDGSATKTLATLSSSAVTLHSDVNVPASIGGSWVLLSAASPSGISETDFTISTSYRSYIFIISNVRPASAASFRVKAFLDGTIKSTGYLTQNTFAYVNAADDDYNVEETMTTTEFMKTENVGNTTAQGGICAFMTLTSPTNTSVPHRFYGNFNFVNQSTYIYGGVSYGHDNNTTEAITKMRFYFEGQNIVSGNINMYGIKDA